MMVNKRLLHIVEDSKKFIWGNVLLQWSSLFANMVMMTALARFLAAFMRQEMNQGLWWQTLLITVAAVVVRFICTFLSSYMAFRSSKAVKGVLRERIYEKMLKLGTSYQEKVQTSEIVQVAVEGVEQLETYFGAYLPQFFYALLAPVTLFAYLCVINVPAALVLFVCVPLIPISIAVVQTWAKKLLSKYWSQYTVLGDSFLENLQGLTTLKIYQADEYKNEKMNEEAEKFRKITMKVLSMQLNSIIIMDVIAYGGAALGMLVALSQFRAGNVSLEGSLLILFLSADFFLPMRQLGSFFHIAMNGMAASDKIFQLLDLPEADKKEKACPEHIHIRCSDLQFSYEEERPILKGIDLDIEKGSFVALVGESGCGKSTIASLLVGKNKGYKGSIYFGDTQLSQISEESLMKNVTYIGHQSYLFKGTVRENLLMGNQVASDAELWKVLERVNLSAFLKAEKGLDTLLMEKGANFSGGQRQRLALARALLHDSQIYIFDEATSNIDVESENDIMREVHKLAKHKTVIIISHRLANVVHTDRIYVLDQGNITEKGNHAQLLKKQGVYAKLWQTQQSLEHYGKEDVA